MQTLVNRCKQTIGRLEKAAHHLQRRIDTAEPEDEDFGYLDDDLSKLRGEIDDLEAEHARAGEEVGKLEDDKEPLEDVYRTKKDQAMKKLDEVEGHFSAMNNIKEAIADISDKLEKYRQLAATVQTELENGQADVGVIESDIQKELAAGDEMGFGERQELELGLRELQSAVQAMQVVIAQETDERGDEAEITKDYHDKKRKYYTAVSDCKNLENFSNKMCKAMRTRKNAFKEFQQHIALRSQYSFHTLMGQRQYAGELVINFAEETLKILAEPRPEEGGPSQNTQQNTQGLDRAVASLSGGERSFTAAWYVSI